MIGVRVSHIDGRQILPRLEDLGSQPMGLDETELRIDHQHVLLAGDHRGVHVVSVLPLPRVHFQIELCLGADGG